MMIMMSCKRVMEEGNKGTKSSRKLEGNQNKSSDHTTPTYVAIAPQLCKSLQSVDK